MSSATATEEQLRDGIERLARERGERPDAELERRILSLRHQLGMIQVSAETGTGERADPAFDQLPAGDGIPAIAAAELTPGLVSAALLRHGSLLVRGLIEPEEAARFAARADQTLAARDIAPGEEGMFEEFEPDPRYKLYEREFVGSTGSIWTADSPRVMFELLEMFRRTGLDQVAAGYLGEPAALSVNKCVLRKVAPTAGAGWHQDGAFLGEVRALNSWIALTRCGDIAPGIDIVARRLDEIVPTGTEGADFDWSVSPRVAAEAAGDAGISRPIFDPGDMLLFDDRCLHATGASPEMTELRYAVETWFFASSDFPDDYTPLGI